MSAAFSEMRQCGILLSVLAIVLCFAIWTESTELNCRTSAAPACIYNVTTKLFAAKCASVITKYDTYQPKPGRQCSNRVNNNCIWRPYTATTGNCQLVVDHTCTIIERKVCKSTKLCNIAKCSWPGDPKICKSASCRFKGGSCNITADPTGTSCWDEARMRNRPCVKGVCNGKGRCDVIGRDKEDCTSTSDVQSCLKGMCRNDTCVTRRAPAGTICTGIVNDLPSGCRTSCCKKFFTCNTRGICGTTPAILPPVGTPCLQTATPCHKGACDGHGACQDKNEKVPAGWPCLLPDFDATNPIALCNTMECDANAQCKWVNVPDGLFCSEHQTIPDPYDMLPPMRPVEPRPPAPPFVPPNVTGSCFGYCYRGGCKGDLKTGPCNEEDYYTYPGCEIKPTNPCSCDKDVCVRTCST